MNEDLIRSILVQSINDTVSNIGNDMADKLSAAIGSGRGDPRYYKPSSNLVEALRNPPLIPSNAKGIVNISFYDRSMLISKPRAKKHMYGTHYGFPKRWGSSIDEVYYYQNFGYYAPGNMKDREHKIPGVHFIEDTFGLQNGVNNVGIEAQIQDQLENMIVDEFIQLYSLYR